MCSRVLVRRYLLDPLRSGFDPAEPPELRMREQPQLAFAVNGVVDDEYEKVFAACKGHERIPDLIDGYVELLGLAPPLVEPPWVR